MSNAELTGLMDVATGEGLQKAPTGITGLDEITKGGLPLGRVTLVAGGVGTGKTLLGLEFLAAGARHYGDPGVLMTFEETEAKVALNVRSLGFDLDELARDGLLEVLSFRLEPAEIFATGEFDFEPLFALLDDAIEPDRREAIVLDTIEVLFSTFGDTNRPF